MTGIKDKILRRIRSHGRGNWVCTPKNFLDLGSRVAVDQALSRLTADGQIRRIGRGFYDLPRRSTLLKRDAPARMERILGAIERRDGVTIMPDGITAANELGLTTAVPAKISYTTNGPTKTVKVDGNVIHLRRSKSDADRYKVDKTMARLIQALRWLGPFAGADPHLATLLKRNFSVHVRRDLIRSRHEVPDWAIPVLRRITPDPFASP